ncbi:hypothetical protein RHGRI_000147 [Rhododendron griersonianum]|uniref:DDE Tnp4 domain-containing protein n=1 Tax=Rhododendron griersonianum TaxID=479676 RepID=A0AAV6LGC0_9ERIC|nr:hypothetical protein RHGRI_000147 [Rhododendron griersonianum]
MPYSGKYYLVDSGYPNSDGYLAPYKGCTYHLEDFRRSRKRQLDAYEYYNRWHSSLRCAIERTFGVWKSRWRMMKETSTYPLRIHKLFVIASMAIHNYIRRNSVHDDEFAEAIYKDERYVFEDMPDIDPEYAAQEDTEGFMYPQSANTLDMDRVRQGIMKALHDDRVTVEQPQRRRRN